MSDPQSKYDDDTQPGAAISLLTESTESHGEEEPWLVSYADLMTLLFGFFAMLFTYATFEEPGTIRIRKELMKYFGGSYVITPENLVEGSKKGAKDLSGSTDPEYRMTKDGVEVTFVTNVVFPSGSAELSEDSKPVLDSLLEVVSSLQGKYLVRIEGHTDDQPLASKVFPSNWELSAARAASMVRFFEMKGYPPELLSAIGMGSSRPAVPNRDAAGKSIPENQGHNRRVVLRVIEIKAEEPAKKDVAAAEEKPQSQP